ncbi:DLA class I histocompatibility antigen, A9/A9 alpha chain-like isoform 1-T1 [Clarias gariepinus]|uniref:DLA class I histocompatibility antigen, A9/A9 alpha chain-like isoform X2 n=2 Tax=Clarias gariepinus TaxID=13013 RepID=UPI00234DACB3|nr:DLA class I histocompatibility antigen, A9/A9 alpha chain-like isoform X2 [Clarias gariepinus]
MERTGLMNIIFTACLLYGSADAQTQVKVPLQYLYTAVTPGIYFPEFTAVGLLDGEQFMSYSSSHRTLILKAWIKKIEGEVYWQSVTKELENNEDHYKSTFTRLMKELNHSKGVDTLQRMYGCEQNGDGTTRGYDHYAYDGDDFISLNLTTETWSAANAKALNTKHKWESDSVYTKYWKNYLESTCTDSLMKYGKETLKRKVRPEVSVFHRHLSPSPEVVCHATGFFPKPLNITWQKDGEDVGEDVELRETLPNQDGSFQKRSILKVPAEELQKHTYTCVVQHSSLEKELVREVPKGGRSAGVRIAIITPVVAAFVTVVSGIVIWKKKNSGFRAVPPGSSSEEDSSSNNS